MRGVRQMNEKNKNNLKEKVRLETTITIDELQEAYDELFLDYANLEQMLDEYKRRNKILMEFLKQLFQWQNESNTISSTK
jgi:hypothetical protein